MKRITLLCLLALNLISCSKKAPLQGGTKTGTEDNTPQGKVLRGAVFSFGQADPSLSSVINTSIGGYDPNSNSSAYGVISQLDAFLPNLTTAPQRGWPFVKNCDAARYEFEKRVVQDIARMDPTRRLIPVRYAISVGTLVDDIARLAHERALLRKDHSNRVPIVVGAINNSNTIYGANSYHYFANATQAKLNFIRGDMCFFDLVQVEAEEDGNHGAGFDRRLKQLDGTFVHGNSVMYYGENDYTAEPEKSPRLFQKLSKLSDAEYRATPPQIIPLYVADFRSHFTQLDGSSFDILNPAFASSATRRKEYMETFKKVFLLANVVRYHDRLVQVLSSYHTVLGTNGTTNFSYQPYEGVPQLLRFIVHAGVQATVMSTNYTPIVLDLGKRGILTSSVNWGTFFNATLLRDHSQTDQTKAYQVSHQTAWVGGDIQFQNEPNSIGPYFKPVASDGFLVLPNADGSVSDARNLFGSSTPVTVGGVTRTYANGYQALAAMAGKNCSVASSDPKTQFIGPWDIDIFGKVKVWIDRNRNGVVDPGEVLSLAEAGVAAFNGCMVANQTESDKFGNNTSMRSIFLYMPGEPILGNEAEILRRLTTATTSFGGPAEFRVSVDILFGANTQSYLQDIPPANIGL